MLIFRPLRFHASCDVRNCILCGHSGDFVRNYHRHSKQGTTYSWVVILGKQWSHRFGTSVSTISNIGDRQLFYSTPVSNHVITDNSQTTQILTWNVWPDAKDAQNLGEGNFKNKSNNKKKQKKILQALTVHALLPPINVLAVAIYFTLFFDIYRHPALERATFTVNFFIIF